MRKLAQQTNANWTKTALFSSLQEFSTGVGIYWPDATRMCQPQGTSFCPGEGEREGGGEGEGEKDLTSHDVHPRTEARGLRRRGNEIRIVLTRLRV